MDIHVKDYLDDQLKKGELNRGDTLVIVLDETSKNVEMTLEKKRVFANDDYVVSLNFGPHRTIVSIEVDLK